MFKQSSGLLLKPHKFKELLKIYNEYKDNYYFPLKILYQNLNILFKILFFGFLLLPSYISFRWTKNQHIQYIQKVFHCLLRENWNILYSISLSSPIFGPLLGVIFESQILFSGLSSGTSYPSIYHLLWM